MRELKGEILGRRVDERERRVRVEGGEGRVEEGDTCKKGRGEREVGCGIKEL